VSVTPISGNTMRQYFEQRSDDLQQLAQALHSGDLAGAQKAYDAIVNLGKQGPFKNGVPFVLHNREQDFQAIGKALGTGDLDAARQAMTALAEAMQQPAPNPVPPGPSSPGPAAVVNLSGGQ
jgi:hypothetical protein